MGLSLSTKDFAASVKDYFSRITKRHNHYGNILRWRSKVYCPRKHMCAHAACWGTFVGKRVWSPGPPTTASDVLINMFSKILVPDILVFASNFTGNSRESDLIDDYNRSRTVCTSNYEAKAEAKGKLSWWAEWANRNWGYDTDVPWYMAMHVKLQCVHPVWSTTPLYKLQNLVALSWAYLMTPKVELLENKIVFAERKNHHRSKSKS